MVVTIKKYRSGNYGASYKNAIGNMITFILPNLHKVNNFIRSGKKRFNNTYHVLSEGVIVKVI
jgi:hypothetical protein